MPSGSSLSRNVAHPGKIDDGRTGGTVGAMLRSGDSGENDFTVLSSTNEDRVSINRRELERDLQRKNNALAETAALLVLSKKVAAIFHRGEDE